MKIFSASEMRDADKYTIAHEPITPLSLMERAGKACFQWINANIPSPKSFVVVCGMGNNGGDGLVIARLLCEKKIQVSVIVLSTGKPTEEFQTNFELLSKCNIPAQVLKEGENLSIPGNCIVIDCIFGTGLSRPVSGWLGSCIDTINSMKARVISIDLPSGLFADQHTDGKVVCATTTLTFQQPKLAFFFQENEKYTGDFQVIDINLDKNFIENIPSQQFYITTDDVKKLIKKRSRFVHKGNFGHSLLVCGSKGKIGAAVLSARACLRAGSGLVTVHVPRCGNTVLQTAIPEAMTITDENEEYNTRVEVKETYSSVGVGPGLGTNDQTKKMLHELMERMKKPMVIDADALNIISQDSRLLQWIPVLSILTPHPKEFERLVGKSTDDFDRHRKQLDFSREHNLIVVLKGAYTCISTPSGESFFNSTGNPGMAKGGTGDALTGILTSLLSQGYEPLNAAILGVFIHGLAGDFAAMNYGVNSMLSSDLIENIPKAFDLLN